MDRHARGLLDRDGRFVLVQDPKRYVFGFGPERRHRPRLDCDCLLTAQRVGGFRRNIMNSDSSLSNPLLQTRTAVLGEFFAQESVEPLAAVGRLRYQRHLPEFTATGFRLSRLRSWLEPSKTAAGRRTS
jgi:hypothetical protein